MSTEIISQDNDFTIVKLDRSFGGARTEVFKIDGTTGAVTGADGAPIGGASVPVDADGNAAIAGQLTVASNVVASGLNSLSDVNAAGTVDSLQLTVGAGSNKLRADEIGVGFFGKTPIAQPSATGQLVGHSPGTGAAVTEDSVFTGGTGTKAYTVGDIVKQLKLLGLLASS